MRASLYARVSTEDQLLGYSLDAQSRAFNNLVKDRSWSIYRQYVEEGPPPTLTMSESVPCSLRP